MAQAVQLMLAASDADPPPAPDAAPSIPPADKSHAAPSGVAGCSNPHRSAQALLYENTGARVPAPPGPFARQPHVDGIDVPFPANVPAVPQARRGPVGATAHRPGAGKALEPEQSAPPPPPSRLFLVPP